MPQTYLKTEKNQSLECCKLAASFFVVFIHAPFPGELGGMVTCLARFAVPLFFAISGYFSFGADSRRLGRRIRHILGLNLTATLIYAVWGCFRTMIYGGGMAEYLLQAFRRESIFGWLLLHINPFAGHLWYLTAILACYLILWAYVRFFGKHYRPLYILGGCLFAAFLAMGEFASITGIGVDYRVYRNGWFLGLPMFALGIFLREYQERILGRTGGKLPAAVLAGVLCSMLEWQILGATDLYIGTVIAVAALLLLLVSHPGETGMAKRIGRFGSLSTWIYLWHLLLIEAYKIFWQLPLHTRLGTAEGYLYPVMIACMSAAAGLLWMQIAGWGKKIKLYFLPPVS